MMSTVGKPSPTVIGRPKKAPKSLVITLKISKGLEAFPTNLSAGDNPFPIAIANSTTTPDTTAAAPSPRDENASESATPAPSQAEDAAAMPPPTEPVRKGTKRMSTAADGTPKQRGKPGPKKKAKLDDGTEVATSFGRPAVINSTGKLGPKANQGAINAGLRALDRTGKPTRKWQKSSFQFKSFTGVVWGVPRWNAPAKAPSFTDLTTPSSSDGSAKENKDSPAAQSDDEVIKSPRQYNGNEPAENLAASSPAQMAMVAG